jgi:hypothetical protein
VKATIILAQAISVAAERKGNNGLVEHGPAVSGHRAIDHRVRRRRIGGLRRLAGKQEHGGESKENRAH